MSGLMREVDGDIPAHLRQWWDMDQLWCFHTADWWRRHWARTGILDVEVADTMTDGWRFWLESLRAVAPSNGLEIRALETDAGRHIGYVRLVGRRRSHALVSDPITSIPAQYEKKPLLRRTT